MIVPGVLVRPRYAQRAPIYDITTSLNFSELANNELMLVIATKFQDHPFRYAWSIVVGSQGSFGMVMTDNLIEVES